MSNVPLYAFSVIISNLIDDTSTEPEVERLSQFLGTTGLIVIKQDGYTIVCDERGRKMYVSQQGFNFLAQKYASSQAEEETTATSIINKIKKAR